MEQQEHSGILLVTWPHDSNTDERERAQWDIQPFVGDLWGWVSSPLEGGGEKMSGFSFPTVINPPRVHISLSHHCGIESVESQFGK